MQGSDSQKAISFKEKGNQYFKNKEYNKAIDAYTQAISKEPLYFLP